MVAGEEEYRDAGAGQPAHGSGKIQACAHVLPIAIVKIAGDDNKVHAAGDGLGDQLVEGGAWRAADILGRDAFIAGEALEGAVEVDVCGVEEGEAGHVREYVLF